MEVPRVPVTSSTGWGGHRGPWRPHHQHGGEGGDGGPRHQQGRGVRQGVPKVPVTGRVVGRLLRRASSSCRSWPGHVRISMSPWPWDRW